MSLINEALRKARKDAAEQDAEVRGVTYRPPRAHLPTERSWLPALAGVALGAVIAAAAFLFLMPRGASEPHATPASSESPVEASEPATELAPVPERDLEPAAAPEPLPAPESDLEPAPRTQAEPKREPDPPPTKVQAAEPALPQKPSLAEPQTADQQTESTPRRVEPPTRVGQVDEAVYVLEAEVDGISLRLDFIVWAPPNPFAQINGRQVSVGQTVDGLIVRAIERDAVTLEGEDGPFKLRVR